MSFAKLWETLKMVDFQNSKFFVIFKITENTYYAYMSGTKHDFQVM